MAAISAISLGLIAPVALFVVPVFSTTFESFDFKLSTSNQIVQASYKYEGVLLLIQYMWRYIYKKDNRSKSYSKMESSISVVSLFVVLMLLYLLVG